jgi:hypothetical protein
MARLIKGNDFRSPGVYTREIDLSTIVRSPYTPEERKQKVKEILRDNEELLSEIVFELRQEKINKIKNEIKKR